MKQSRDKREGGEGGLREREREREREKDRERELGRSENKWC